MMTSRPMLMNALLALAVLPCTKAQQGESSCPCLEWADLSNYITGGYITYKPVGSGTSYQYPPDYGNAICKAHDAGMPPVCSEPNPPSWCTSKWCWVSKSNCVGASATRSVFFPTESNLYFSYDTCGDFDTFSSWSTGSGMATNLCNVIGSYLESSRLQIEDAYSKNAGTVNLECVWQDQCQCTDCSYNSYWMQNVNFADVGTWFRPGLDSSLKTLASCMSKAVGDTYRKVAAIEYPAALQGARIGYQYFAEQAGGSYIQWPLTDWCPASEYDPRFRPWYAAGATGPKDVLIVVDVSGSMTTADRHLMARKATEAVLNTLTWKDFATVVLFNHGISAKYSSILLPVTNNNRAAMLQWLDQQEWNLGGTNFRTAITEAFDIISDSVAATGGTASTSTCQRAMVFLTDGDDANIGETDFAEVQAKASEWDTIIFTYALGSGANQATTWRLACENNGIFYPVADGEDLSRVMSDYYVYFAAGQETCNPSYVRYADADTSEILYAGCLPMYDRSANSTSLLGVSCMDVNMLASISDLEAQPNLAWEQLVCEMSDISKTCRPVELSECHREKLRAKVSSRSVCGASAPTTDCPCLDRGCQDDENWLDEEGYLCYAWVGDDCDTASSKFGYSASGQAAVLQKCKRSCGKCEWKNPCPYTDTVSCSSQSTGTGSHQCQACRGFVSGVGIDEQPMCCPDQAGPQAPQCSALTTTTRARVYNVGGVGDSNSNGGTATVGPGDSGSDTAENDGTTVVIIGVVVGVAVVIGAVAGVVCFMRKSQKGSSSLVTPVGGPVIVGSAPPAPIAGGASGAPGGSGAPASNNDNEKEVETNAPVLHAGVIPTAIGASAATEPLPKNWKHQDPAVPFFSIEPAPEMQALVQQMLDATFKNIKTRDRKDGAVPTKLQVAAVQRIENSRQWQTFAAERRRIEAKRGRAVGLSGCTQLSNLRGGEALTLSTAAGGLQVVSSTLNPSINEILLWHGTTPSGAMGIAESGFDLSRAGSAAGSMYGPGVYLAECSSKSDEYARDDASGVQKGLYCLLLCRVVLGELLTLTTGGDSVHALVKTAMESGSYDSVLGDREASVGTYREFVAPRSAQVMPEYVVLYNRL